jgi:hypothetical protein
MVGTVLLGAAVDNPPEPESQQHERKEPPQPEGGFFLQPIIN